MLEVHEPANSTAGSADPVCNLPNHTPVSRFCVVGEGTPRNIAYQEIVFSGQENTLSLKAMGIPECPEPGASRNTGWGQLPYGDCMFPRHNRHTLPWSSDGSSGHGVAMSGVTPSQRDGAFPADRGPWPWAPSRQQELICALSHG